MTLSGTHEFTGSLSAPVGALMRPTASLAPEDSLDRAAAELRRSGNGLVPVVHEGRLLGVVTESSLASSLASAVSPTEPLTVAMVQPPTVRPYTTAAEALRYFAESSSTSLLVIDDSSRLMGLLSPSDLYPRRRVPPRPALVGGMATPFGVYLTNGTVAAGAKGLALVATGVLMYGMLIASQLAAYPILLWLSALQVPEWLLSVAASALPVVGFLLTMRLVPLSGTHAAEHQVVHAIERGEELKPEVVRRMPRVHPRCGTNLAVGAILFVGIFDLFRTENTMFALLPAAIVTALFWRRLGSLFQLFVTTKPASDSQLRGGIKAGEELLEKYASTRIAVPSIPLRIWRSGILHVMAGSFICLAIFLLIDELIFLFWNVRLPIQVQ